MPEQILRLLKAVLASLYMLFEGIPALEALRSWFGLSEDQRGINAAPLVVVAGAIVLGLAAFLAFLWFIGRSSSTAPLREGKSTKPR
jgi:hypothetical protein